MDNLVKIFNEKLMDFIDDLAPVLSNVSEYALVSSSAKWVCKFDPTRNYKVYHQYIVVPYGDRIARRDEAFFLETMSVSGLNSKDAGGMGMGIVSLLRNVWRTQLVDSDKDAVWGHLQVLAELSKRCMAMSNMSSSNSSAI